MTAEVGFLRVLDGAAHPAQLLQAGQEQRGGGAGLACRHLAAEQDQALQLRIHQRGNHFARIADLLELPQLGGRPAQHEYAATERVLEEGDAKQNAVDDDGELRILQLLQRLPAELEQFLGVRLPLARHLDSARAGAGQALHVGEAFTEVKVDELSLDDRVHTHEL